MTQLPWLEQYSGQSTDELISLEGKYRTDSLVVAFDQALNQKAARVGVAGLTQEERTILAIQALESEVNNGGYDQFFLNSSNEYTPIVVESLKRIGCPETAALTEDAVRALGIKGPLTVGAVESAMQEENAKRDAKLEKLTNRYFETAGDLSGPLLEFIKRNQDKIRLNA